MPTLSLCMIVRDEEHHLATCLDSVKQFVDEIVIVDTGSTDGTRDIARAYGAKLLECTPTTHPSFFFKDDESSGVPGPHSGMWCLANFGEARNISFDAAKSDYIMWLDADDIVVDACNLPKIVTNMASNNLDAAIVRYDYGVDPNGVVNCVLWRERIIRRQKLRWVNVIHEVLVPLTEYAAKVYDVSITHRRGLIKPLRQRVPNRNYKVLLKHCDDTKDNLDARTLFYLGNEARFIDHDKAIWAYEKYVGMSGWDEERARARISLGNLIEQRKDYTLAYANYAAATVDSPVEPDAWFALARIAYYKNDWAKCIQWTEKGFSLGEPDSMIVVNPLERKLAPHIYYNVALSRVGRVEEAFKSCVAGLQYDSKQEHLLHNKALYEEYLANNKTGGQVSEIALTFHKHEDLSAPSVLPNDMLVIMVTQLWKKLMGDGDVERAKLLLDAVPDAITGDVVVVQMRNHTRTKSSKLVSVPARIKHSTTVRHSEVPTNKHDIIIWTGPSIEWWSPNTPTETGIGGSETACIEMARRLVNRGHKVRVYSDCPHMDGDYSGVTYKHFGAIQPFEKCDIFISSRQPAAIDHSPMAKAKFLWVHDIHVGGLNPDLHKRLLKYDRVLALSWWHKQFLHDQYPILADDAIIETRNGIVSSRFNTIPNKKNIVVFTSSANRGLEALLNMWPMIRAAVPGCELHVYYGFESWARSAVISGSKAELAEIDRYKQRISTTSGVVLKGRVPQQVLAAALLEATAWVYPTMFTETSCISAMEAQAAGCIPVTTSVAALSETVKHGVLLPPTVGTTQYSNDFIDATVKILTNEQYRKPLADAAHEYAVNNLDWDGVVDQWEQLFDDTISKVAINRVPDFREIM